MNKKLSLFVGVFNFFVAAGFIAVAAVFLYLLIRFAANFNNLGYAAIAGILAFPFLGFAVILFAGGGTGFAVINIKGLIALKKRDTEKLKFVALTSAVLSGAVFGFCALVLVSCVLEALTATSGGNYDLLLYILIPLAVAAANFILNFVILRKLKRGTDKTDVQNNNGECI